MDGFRILTIDGGGIRGVVPAIVLERLCAEPELASWLDHVDLFAGTSTGGILALGLAAGLSVSTIRDLYEQRSASVFHDTLFDDIRDLGKIIGADYSIANLQRELERVFGDRTLGSLSRRVLITAFDLDNEAPGFRTWKPKLFHNFPGSDSDAEQLARSVAAYTSAAPTYFESVDGYIDGGVYATNPSMCALAQTQDPRVPASERTLLGDVRLLSLGTGRSLVYIEGDRHDWGYLQWVRPLISLMLDGTNGIADYQCARILGDRYFRLAPTFPPGREIAMDDVNEIPYLVDFALSLDLGELVGWLRDTWVDLTP